MRDQRLRLKVCSGHTTEQGVRGHVCWGGGPRCWRRGRTWGAVWEFCRRERPSPEFATAPRRPRGLGSEWGPGCLDGGLLGGRAGPRVGGPPGLPGLAAPSTPPPSTSARLFPPSGRAPAGHWLGHGFLRRPGGGGSGGVGAVVFRVRGHCGEGRRHLSRAQTPAQRLTMCMLICLHRKKEIAEIPEKIASRQRLIVNLDRKVPRERKAKAGARGSGGGPGRGLSPGPARSARPGPARRPSSSGAAPTP